MREERKRQERLMKDARLEEKKEKAHIIQRQKEMKARDECYERERKRIESKKAIKIQEAHANMLNKLRKRDNSWLGRIQDILCNLIKSKHEVRTFELLAKLVDEIIERFKTFQKLLNEAKQERY